MAQVIVSFIRPESASSGGAQALPRSARSVEVTSSGTAADTGSVKAKEGEFAQVHNMGTGVIWLQIGSSPTAAVASSSDRNQHAIGANQVFEYGPLREDDIVSVIDDS